MASRIIIQQSNEAGARIASNAVSSQSLVSINSTHNSATVQRIVKSQDGTQYFLSEIGSGSQTVGVNLGTKRPHTPDQQSQPPSKIKLTYSNSNTNVPIVSSVQPRNEQTEEKPMGISLLTDGGKSPHRLMHVTGNQKLPGNARRLVLSPVRSTGKVTMLPVSGKNQIKTMPQSGNMLNVGRRLSLNNSVATSGGVQPSNVTLSPQKLIIRGQDNTTHNVVLQQKGSTGIPGITNSSTNLQPVTVSGSKFQYVRLVPSNSLQSVSQSTNVQTTGSQQRTLAPSTAAPQKLSVTSSQVKTTKSSQPPSQRLILPATSQVPIRPNFSGAQYSHLNSSVPGSGQALTNLPPGTAIISSGQNLQGVQGFALVPAQYVTQLQQQYTPQQSTTQHSHSQIPAVRQDNSYVQIQPSAKTTNRVQNGAQGNITDSGSSNNRPRKPCNCTKSQCLKLYCECFANGEFCLNCNCNNCYNNLEHEDERSRAIKACLDRNPNAFRPKIGKDKNIKGERRHNKGCNCKRSGCLKNYCECYEAKIMCSHLCKCVGCKNFEESPEKKTLMHLADAAEVRKQQQVSAKHKLSSQTQDLPSRPAASTGQRLPFRFVTNEVAEATCSCLIAQAEETERTRQIDTIQEKLILEEFGRCLMQVIESSNRTEPGAGV